MWLQDGIWCWGEVECNDMMWQKFVFNIYLFSIELLEISKKQLIIKYTEAQTHKGSFELRRVLVDVALVNMNAKYRNMDRASMLLLFEKIPTHDIRH